MNETKYPRIWDCVGERKIIGETKVSWIVVARGRENDRFVAHIDALRENPKTTVKQCAWHHTFNDLKRFGYIELVPKKNPNKTTYPRWFFSEEDRADHVFQLKNQNRLGEAVKGCADPKILRQIAALIGYEEKALIR